MNLVTKISVTAVSISGSLNKGKTGGDGCHRMSFDRRLLKSDWLRRIDPIPKESNVVCESDPVTHSPHYLPLQRECSNDPLSSQGPGHRRILMAYIG